MDRAPAAVLIAYRTVTSCARSTRRGVERALPAFMARRMPRVEIVVRNSMQLVRYQLGTDPHTAADVARTIGSTLDFLAAGRA